MKIRHLATGVLLPLACSSCTVVQWPARAVNHVIAPLTANAIPQALPGDGPASGGTMIALRLHLPFRPGHPASSSAEGPQR